MKYISSGFRDKRPEFPCLESRLFRDWSFGAGTNHHGKRKGKPRKAKIEEKGGIALLTTLFPGDNEVERRIIGLYKINEVTNNKDEETKFFADDKLRIRLPLDEAKQLFFWDYYSINSDKPLWGTGLFRYLDDGQVKRILLDLKQTVQSEQHEEILEELLKDFGSVQASKRGMRTPTVTRNKRIAIARKYGGAGEGENHKRLKEWVACHPEIIGLANVMNHEVEHPFISGDAVDILFEQDNGNDAVVEIETTTPLPGCHQAIKYRALRCAERLLPLDSDRVKAILVAWEVQQQAKDFCEEYNILWYEIKI